MALPASDSFTYADGALSTRTGNFWSIQTSNNDLLVSSNTAIGNTTGFNCNYWNQDTFNDNQWSQATITDGNTNSNHKTGVTVRNSTVANSYYYWVQIYNQNIQRLFKIVAGGTRTQIGSDYTNTYAAGRVFRLEADGTLLTPHWGGSALLTQTDTSLTSGNAGIFVQYQGTGNVDSWTGGNIGKTESDNFDRTNGNLIAPWVVVESNCTIVSNQLKGTASTGNTVYYNTTCDNDQFSQVTLVNGGSDQGVCVRMKGGVNFYVFITSGVVMQLYRVSAGSYLKLGADYALNAVAGTVIRLEIVGSVLTPYFNGVAQSTRTNSDLAAGKPGLRIFNTTAIFDNWSGGDILPAGPTSLKGVNGLATASIKTIDGLAIASVKSVYGLI